MILLFADFCNVGRVHPAAVIFIENIPHPFERIPPVKIPDPVHFRIFTGTDPVFDHRRNFNPRPAMIAKDPRRAFINEFKAYGAKCA